MGHHPVQVRRQAGIGGMDDEIDPVGGVLGPQGPVELIQPVIQLFGGTGIEGGKGAGDPGPAGGQDQFRSGNQEHGGGNGGHGEAPLKQGGNGHGSVS